jgi:hypothetical protein
MSIPTFFIAGNRVPAIQNSMRIDHTTNVAAGAKIDVSIKTLPFVMNGKVRQLL